MKRVLAETGLVAEDLDLAVATMKWLLFIRVIAIKCVDLDMQRQSFNAFLIAEIRAQTLHRDANL